MPANIQLDNDTSIYIYMYIYVCICASFAAGEGLGGGVREILVEGLRRFSYIQSPKP